MRTGALARGSVLSYRWKVPRPSCTCTAIVVSPGSTGTLVAGAVAGGAVSSTVVVGDVVAVVVGLGFAVVVGFGFTVVVGFGVVGAAVVATVATTEALAGGGVGRDRLGELDHPDRRGRARDRHDQR